MSYNFNLDGTWKEEQISYFKKYIKSFKKNSHEYRLIKKGIDELEKGI